MKKSMSKKILSLFLATLMLFCSVPFTNMTASAKTEFTHIASTDFTNSTWGSSYPTLYSGDNSLSWDGYVWQNSVPSTSDGSGAYVADGYIYLKDTPPIKDNSSWQIDVEFSLDSNNLNNISNDDGSLVKGNASFITISNRTVGTQGWSSDNSGMANGDFLFVHDATGPAYSGSTTLFDGFGEQHSITSLNDFINVDETYHYQLTYIDGYIQADILNSDKTESKTLFIARHIIDTSSINTICFGDDNNNMFRKGVTYKSVTFSVGSENNSSDSKFLFAYFTGNAATSSGDNYDQAIRFAVSEDSRNYQILNDGLPTIVQTKGTYNARDPYIFKGEDEYYYAIATDLNCNADGGWWGNNTSSFVIWRSKDLVNWQDETLIKVHEILNATTYREWAPQVMWDSEHKNDDGTIGAYMVYFGLATSADGYESGTNLYYSYTTDLLDQSKWEMPKLLLDNGTWNKPVYDSSGNITSYEENVNIDDIDSDITYYNGTYYMFYKDERNGTICVVTSDNMSGPYDPNSLVILDAGDDIGALEGCQVFQNNEDHFIFMADRYGWSGHFAVYDLGPDLSSVLSNSNDGELNITNYYDSEASDSISLCSPRHGSILRITDEEYNRLLNAEFGNANCDEQSDGVDLSSNLVARFLVNDQTTDEKGNYNLSQNGSVTWEDSAYLGKVGAAHFSNDNYLVSNQLANLFISVTTNTGFTVSFLAKPYSLEKTDSNDGTLERYFELNINGGKGTIVYPSGNNYISMSANKSTIEICGENYDWWTNRRASSTGYTYKNSWHLYTLTVSSDAYTVYIDGEEAYTQEAESIINTMITNMKNSGYLLIGASGYSDPTYTGYMRDFRIYNKAITADEASKLLTQYSKDSIGDIDTQIERFENQISNSKTYTNMETAYKAYMKAVEYKDSYMYGGKNGKTLTDLASVSAELKKALDNTVEWTGNIVANEYTHWATNTSASGIDQGTSYNHKVLYAGSEQTNETTGHVSAKIDTGEVISEVMYATNVLLYDSDTDKPYFPVMLKVSKENSDAYLFSVHPAASDASESTVWGGWGSRADDFILNNNITDGYSTCWHGTDKRINFGWTIGQSEMICGDAFDWNAVQSDKYVKPASMSNVPGFFSNVVQFNKDLDDDTAVYSRAIKWEEHTRGDSTLDVYWTNHRATTSEQVTYVVNYKSIKDAVNNNSKSYSTDDLEKYYTNVDVMANYLKQLDEATSINPAGYDWSNTVDSVSRYTNDFNNALADLVTLDGSAEIDSQTDYDSLKKAITDYSNVEKDPCCNQTAWDNYQSALQLAYDAINNVCVNNYAITYSGKSISDIANDLVSKANIAKTDLIHTYKYDSITDNVASFVCENHSNSSIDCDIQNYLTMNIIYSGLDFKKYEDNGEQIKEVKAEYDKLFDEKFTDENAVITRADKLVENLLNAINNEDNSRSSVREYVVNFDIVVDGELTSSKTITCNYGSTVSLIASDDDVNNGVCSAWEITAGGTTKRISRNANDLLLLIQENTNVTAYCTNKTDKVVTIDDQYGNTLYEIPFSDSADISYNGNNVTVNETICNVPNMPYMTVNGFTIGEEALISDQIKTVTESVTIKPTFEKGSNTAYIYLDDNLITAASYDKSVTVSVEDAYAIMIKSGDSYSVVAYADSDNKAEYTFFANRDIEFFTLTKNGASYSIGDIWTADAETTFLLDNKLPFVYSGALDTGDETTSRFTTFNSFSTNIPDDVTIVEAGTIYAKNVSDESEFIIDGSGVQKVICKNYVAPGNQYSLSIRNGVGKGVSTRAYIKYTYQYSGRTIEAIAYGNICTM